MSEASVRALLERARSDDSFRERLESAPSREEKQKVVADAGYDVSPSDLDSLRSMAGIHEISDDDLERIAGGGTSTVISAAEDTGTAAASTIIVASAAAAAALA